jgi:hypothetical protein
MKAKAADKHGQKAKSEPGGNQGEGNAAAARVYNDRTREFAQSGPVDAKAREAADALKGPEGEELRKAEAEGRRRAKGEDPALKR